MACAHCRRPWIVWWDRDHFTVSRGCYCAWHVDRVEKPRGDNPYIVPPTPGGWDWLARVYADATQ